MESWWRGIEKYKTNKQNTRKMDYYQKKREEHERTDSDTPGSQTP